MRIADLIKHSPPFVSLEFFPPKDRNDWPAFFRNVERLADINPLFVSVTYGAGGGSQTDTIEIVSRLSREYALETMAHLTCVGAAPDTIRRFLETLSETKVDNILALRGDRPKNAPEGFTTCETLKYASDLISLIRHFRPDMGIGVAGYPETHPEAVSSQKDIEYLKLKLDKGGDFVVTQLFFDNQSYFDFVDRARNMGANKPIIPGILPIVNLNVIKKIVSLCGASVPGNFLEQLEKADANGGAAAVQKAGIAHARRQAEELLAAGVPGIHFYTLNRPDVALELINGLITKL